MDLRKICTICNENDTTKTEMTRLIAVLRGAGYKIVYVDDDYVEICDEIG